MNAKWQPAVSITVHKHFLGVVIDDDGPCEVRTFKPSDWRAKQAIADYRAIGCDAEKFYLARNHKRPDGDKLFVVCEHEILSD